MRTSSFLPQLAVASIAASAAMVSAQSPVAPPPPPPQFTAILTGQFSPSAHYSTIGPFGTRLHLAASGGSLSNVTTGEVVADIISFSDNGVLSTPGELGFPRAIMPLTWSADGHFASVSMNGVWNGNTATEWTYAHVETDSPIHSWMNSKFLIIQIDTSNPQVVGVTMYQEAS